MTRTTQDGVDRIPPGPAGPGGCGADDAADALRNRIVAVATEVEYDVWRHWPADDATPGLFDRAAPWIDAAARNLADPRARPRQLLAAIVMHVVDDCIAHETDPPVRLVLKLLLLHHLEHTPRALRTLTATAAPVPPRRRCAAPRPTVSARSILGSANRDG